MMMSRSAERWQLRAATIAFTIILLAMKEPAEVKKALSKIVLLV